MDYNKKTHVNYIYLIYNTIHSTIHYALYEIPETSLLRGTHTSRWCSMFFFFVIMRA